MQHIPAPAPDESQLKATRTRGQWADVLHDDLPDDFDELTEGVPKIPAAGSRGDQYDNLSDEQIFNLPGPGIQIHSLDNEGDVSIIES